RFANASAPTAPFSAPAAPVSTPAAMTLEEAILRGLKGDAARLAKAALAEQSGLALVEGCLIPALDRVGADYEAGRAFLPQLLSAAQAAQAVFSVIQDSLGGGEDSLRRERVLIATVKGDIHDIGKNIVKTVMSNYGYDLLDLGRDVPPETIAAAAAQENIRLVGLSALMTTTLPAMEETVRLLQKLPHPPAIMLGGAVVTAEYAQRLGAYYARDAKAAVEIARRVFE
ncbi:MAG: cobalamin-dependent protein, partial [Aristaeellaceae bacterium]